MKAIYAVGEQGAGGGSRRSGGCGRGCVSGEHHDRGARQQGRARRTRSLYRRGRILPRCGLPYWGAWQRQSPGLRLWQLADGAILHRLREKGAELDGRSASWSCT